jgi:site-specific DNA-methyltransferase (cytosine-N4-specific)
MWYDEQFQRFDVADNVKLLLKFLLLSILEDISYTSKDGQFLRWDSRSPKVKMRNAKRLAEGKKQFKPFHKRRILGLPEAIAHALDLIVQDVSLTVATSKKSGNQEFMQGTVLESLPMQLANTYDAVITSPPYCNRYDYTRTYALELAFLGIDQKGVLNLRQRLLSATVENRSKLQYLENFYNALGRQGDFQQIVSALKNHSAFQEILDALRLRSQLGQVNNSGVITMVEGYFIELAFVTFELFRVCKRGARVAIVNDNVRYSGEIIPVDLLMTDIAAGFGFTAEKIYVLPQRKGNSSQQMGKYGREALRKSILIWRKPGEPDAV